MRIHSLPLTVGGCGCGRKPARLGGRLCHHDVMCDLYGVRIASVLLLCSPTESLMVAVYKPTAIKLDQIIMYLLRLKKNVSDI